MADNREFRLGNFIKIIQNNRILYDKDHPEYKNNELKEAIWYAISVQFNMNVHQCRSLWTCLCVPYFTALMVVNESEYISRDRIMNRCHLKFLDEHLKNYVPRPGNEELMKQILKEVRREIENEKNAKNGLPSKIMAAVRHIKLNKWSDMSVMKKTHPDKVRQIRKTINGIVVEVVQVMKPEIKRRRALKRSLKSKPIN